MRILEEKGHLTHENGEPRNSITSHNRAIKLDATHSNRFFDKSIEKTVAALVSNAEVSDEQLDRLSRLIEQTNKGGL